MRRLFALLLILILATPTTAQIVDDPPVDPAPQYATADTFALVSVPRANIRAAPSLNGAVADIALAGERYAIVDTSDDGEWYLLQIGGSRGWIFADLVLVSNPDGIPTDESRAAAQVAELNRQIDAVTGTLGVIATINIRQGPATFYPIVGRVPFNGRVRPIARNDFGTWLLVDYGSTRGWISIFLINPPPGYNPLLLPVANR